MAKYGDLIRKARETDNQEGSEPDNQIPTKPDNQTNEQLKTTDRENKPDNQASVKPDNQIDQQLDEEVNLCVKVPKSLRRHWAAEAKRHGITMTEVMTEALIKQFGKPDNQ